MSGRADPAGPTRYLARVASSLRGPRQYRDRILAELRDGLDQSVAAGIGRGLSEEGAVAAAIEDFGQPDAVAAGFATELAIATARHTLFWYLLTGPLVGVWWLLSLQPYPWRAGLVVVIAAIPVLPLIVVAIATATGTVATTGRLIRWLPEASARHAIAGSALVAALAVFGDLVMIGQYVHSGSPARPLGVIAVAASTIRVVCSSAVLLHLVVRGRLTVSAM
jgi:hypothetical protein